MKLTRQLVGEAVELTAFLPRRSAIELSKVLGVSLADTLRCIAANKQHFVFDANKDITKLEIRPNLVQTGSDAIWSWFLENRLHGDPNRCLTLNTRSTLASRSASRIRWEQEFNNAVLTFVTSDKTGSDVRERVASHNGKDLEARVRLLGTINGNGRELDRFIYGILVTTEEIEARKVGSYLIYDPQWAMEEMVEGGGWVEIDATAIGVTPHHTMSVSMDVTTDADAAVEAAVIKERQRLAAEALAAASDAVPEANGQQSSPVEGGRKINRRTKEQLQEARQEMNTKLLAAGVSPADAVKVFNIDKFTEAEAFFKETMASLSKVEAKVEDHPNQQHLDGTVPPPQAKPVDTSVPMVVAETPAPPAIVQPPVERKITSINDIPSAPTVPTVQSLKAEIRETAGMSAPAPIAAPPVTPPVVASHPPIIAAAPPIAAVPAGASADAAALLDGLLKATGQG